MCTSEIDKEALVSYAAIHCGLTNEMIEDYRNYPTKEEMAQYLTNLNIGYVPEKDKHYNWFGTNEKRIKRYWLASKLQNNLGDICRIKELPKADLWTSSFPCTDISVAGKMRGLEADSGTRSSLLWQTIRLLETAKQNNTLPKYILFENVKNLVGKKFIDSFNELISLLGDIGFNTYWQIINGKDCGIPQNRERVFIVCIRKDIDTGLFEFPKPFDNGVRLKDILEKNIPEKYYIKTQKAQDLIDELLKNGTISLENDDGGANHAICPSRNQELEKSPTVSQQEQIEASQTCSKKEQELLKPIGLMKPGFEHNNRVYYEENYCACISAREYKDPLKVLVNENKSNEVKQIGNVSPKRNEGSKWQNPSVNRVYDSRFISPTINTMQGGNRQPMIVEK